MNRVYSSLFLFCGLGAGARGFLDARARLFGTEATFRSIGGIDIDEGACADFEYLTKSPALCADLATMTPGALREFAGPVAPDVVFDSAPCKADSGLTNRELAKSEKYQAMAQLYVTGVELLLSTWDVPPRLIIKENVPRILSNGAERIAQVTKMLDEAGYETHISTHDCGELGGLAQHRRRALLVARLKSKVPALLYQPPKKRVRACGEVLSQLPLPETPSAGPMHRMPRIGWLTWLRLAMIPPGGDHRDLPGVLAEHQARREKWARQHVEAWTDPSVTVTTEGSNGAYGVADPRVETATQYANSHPVAGWGDAARCVTAGASRPIAGGPSVADPRAERWHPGAFGLKGFDESSGTVTGHGHPSGGPFAVADDRVLPQADNPNAHRNKYKVHDLGASAGTISGATRPGSGGPAVADGRLSGHYRGSLGIMGWRSSSGVITSAGNPAKGRFSVADVRVQRSPGRNPDHCLYVLPWSDPSFTVHGQANPGTGAYTIADGRDGGRARAFGILSLEAAMSTIDEHGCVPPGPWAIVDEAGAPLAFVEGAKHSPFVVVDGKRHKVPIVIIAADGTWHRPMTPLELAALQDLPVTVDGKPLKLHGDNVGAWVERIGNAVPVSTARAIAEQMLTTLLASDVGAGLAPSGGAVWVRPELAEATT